MKWRTLIVTGLLVALGTGTTKAEELFETFETGASSRWTYFADTVMGACPLATPYLSAMPRAALFGCQAK